jgi:hypothetical protein
MDNLHIEQMGLGKVADSSQSRVRSPPYVGHTTCDIVPRLLTLLVYEKKKKEKIVNGRRNSDQVRPGHHIFIVL